MPAPSSAQVKFFLLQAMLNNGLVKQEYVNGVAIPVNPIQVTPEMDKLLDALAEGVANTWASWQATQTVFVPGITPGVGATVGTLTP